MTDTAAARPIYLETNAFIMAVEGTRDTAAPAKELIEALRHRRGLAVTSEITLAEVLAPPQRSDALPLHVKRRVYLDLLVWSGFISLVSISRSLLMETADLRSVTRLKLPDAIHLVTAIQRQCRYFVSADKGIRMPANMTRIAPDVRGVAEILRVLA
jgi:predicted nucleic acid-binding protein